MKKGWYTALLIICLVGSAAAFLGDAMEKAIGDLGPELVKIVSLAGEIQTDIARPSAEQLANESLVVQRRMTDLREATEAIAQLLQKMQGRQPLSLARLDPSRREDFLRMFPAEFRREIEQKNVIELSSAYKVYLTIKADVQRDAFSFESALSKIQGVSPTLLVVSGNLANLNNVGKTRGALTASLGRLVEFSGRIQELSYSQGDT